MSSFDSEKSSTEFTEVITQESLEDILCSISNVLDSLIRRNKNLKEYAKVVKKQSKRPFSASSVPQISIYDYLQRISNYAKPEENVFISMLIYIDRFCELSNTVLTEYNIHRILFVALVTAVKFHEDEIYGCNYYAEIGGITLKELLNLEYEFLSSLNFSLFIKDEEFLNYDEHLRCKLKAEKCSP